MTSRDHPPSFTQAPTAPARSGWQASHPHGVPARKVITFHIHRVPVRFRAEKSLALELQGSRLSGTAPAEAESQWASDPACPQLPAGRIRGGAGDHLHPRSSWSWDLRGQSSCHLPEKSNRLLIGCNLHRMNATCIYPMQLATDATSSKSCPGLLLNVAKPKPILKQPWSYNYAPPIHTEVCLDFHTPWLHEMEALRAERMLWESSLLWEMRWTCGLQAFRICIFTRKNIVRHAAPIYVWLFINHMHVQLYS